jgi:hypothetical protein
MLDDEYEQQNRYLATFGLQRNPIVGDGNCLFRAISLLIMTTTSSTPYDMIMGVCLIRRE